MPTGGWFRVPPEPAVYEVLRWEDRHVLEYDESKRTLTVPGTAALPLLAARAATLCSGRVPQRMPQNRQLEPRYLPERDAVCGRADCSVSSPGAVVVSDALTIFDSLIDQYIRYYETPFAVRDEGVQAERHRLLRQEGTISASRGSSRSHRMRMSTARWRSP